MKKGKAEITQQMPKDVARTNPFQNFISGHDLSGRVKAAMDAGVDSTKTAIHNL